METILPIMNQYTEIETCVEVCKISEVRMSNKKYILATHVWQLFNRKGDIFFLVQNKILTYTSLSW